MRTNLAGTNTSLEAVTSGLTGDIWGIDYVDANNIWICAANGGVAKSTNGGTTWTAAGNAGEGAYSIAAIDANIAIVCLNQVLGDGKIMRTTNGGNIMGTSLHNRWCLV